MATRLYTVHIEVALRGSDNFRPLVLQHIEARDADEAQQFAIDYIESRDSLCFRDVLRVVGREG